MAANGYMYEMKGNTAMRTVVAGVAAALALAGLTSPASASSSRVAAGNFTWANVSDTTLGAAAGDTYITETGSYTYKGALSGVAFDTDAIVAHHDGSLSGQGTETCASCTINGRTGSYTALTAWTTKGGVTTGTQIFTHGGGGLKGLRGGGSFTQGKTSGSYSYSYSFAK